MLSRLIEKLPIGTCHSGGRAAEASDAGTAMIALVGSPNVGKSVLFSNLTGTYVTVSNYPGTTVEVARGTAHIDGRPWQVVDTPGMYSMLPLSEEERVARRILLREKPDVVLNVVDASNLQRMLPLTLQLIDAGLPVVLVLNMLDEAEKAAVEIDQDALQEELGVPLVGTVSTTQRGMEELRKVVCADVSCPAPDRRGGPSASGDIVGRAVAEIAERLEENYSISRGSLAMLLLQEDEEAWEMLEASAPEEVEPLREVVQNAREAVGRPMEYAVALRHQRRVRRICGRVVESGTGKAGSFAQMLSDVMTHPVFGAPIVIAVLYFGLYQLVGVFGAGTVVDFLEGVVFEEYVNPGVQTATEAVVPWVSLQDLVAGEYGIITLGLRYAVAIILPIVTLFFLVFSFLEDVGYLPRLALLLDRIFKKLGMSGRAVIPMVLGFGCDTMATMVTRTLSSKRERLIAVLLLSVAVPCSAQLGVIMGLLSGVPGALLIWAGVLAVVYVVTGLLASRLIPGRASSFYVEVPPLRWPQPANIAKKTFARVKWYFKEVLPLFVAASVLIWLGRLTGLFGLLLRGLSYPVRWVGLPAESAEVFLFGFFRRDYGAAGLYDLSKEDLFTGTQIVVAAVALTLFMPCIAHFLMTIRERGWKQSAAIAACTLGIAFVTALTLSFALNTLGVTL
ncbi:MAG: ferrous iron transport protein B [Candidatus Brocadiia bacterium]